MSGQEAGAPTLKRELSLLDSTMINIGSMVGSGIFLVPAAVALQLQSWWLIVLVWVLGGIVSLFGALSVAELGAMSPEAGGQYVYLRNTYGPLWGFLFGWTSFAVIMSASIAAVGVGFATYLGHFIPMSDMAIKAVAIGSILLLTTINCFGVKVGASVQNGLTLLKVSLLAFFVLFAIPSGGVAHLQSLVDLPPSGIISRLGIALVAVLWCYDGWIEITYVASEVKDPQRTIPRSLVIGMVSVILLYIIVNCSFLWILSIDTVSRSSLVAADAASILMGPIGAIIAVCTVMLSTLSSNNGFVLTGARITYAMAARKEFFSSLGRVHPQFSTPVASLLAQGFWSSALVLSGTFDQLFTYVVFAQWIFYGLTAAAVIVSRRRSPEISRPYRTWGYPITPIAFILFALWFVINTLIENPRDALFGLGIVMLGLPAYFFWAARKTDERLRS